MAFNLTNAIGTGTDDELLEFARAAIAQILLTGQAYGINGRTFDRADLAQLRETVTWLEGRVDAASGAAAAPKETVFRLLRS